MRDKYVTGQAGAVGPGSSAHDMTFSQVWTRIESDTDLAQLKADLAQLREHLRRQATRPEHDIAIGEVAAAEVAAEQGDGPEVLSHLSRAGKWTFDVATSVGTTVASAALKAALGL